MSHGSITVERFREYDSATKRAILKGMVKEQETKTTRDEITLGDHDLLCPLTDPDPAQFEGAYGSIKAMPGMVLVEMDPWTRAKGDLELPDTVAERMRPTAGTVLAVGYGDKYDLSELNSGDRVIVGRWNGRWIRGAKLGGYQCQGQLRYYGVLTTDPKRRITINPIIQGIVAKLNECGLQMLGDKVYIRRDPAPTTSYGLILPESKRSGKATVVAAGKNTGLKPGDRVLYDVHSALTYIEFLAERYGLPGDPSDYVMIDSRGGIVAMLEGEEVAA